MRRNIYIHHHGDQFWSMARFFSRVWLLCHNMLTSNVLCFYFVLPDLCMEPCNNLIIFDCQDRMGTLGQKTGYPPPTTGATPPPFTIAGLEIPNDFQNVPLHRKQISADFPPMLFSNKMALARTHWRMITYGFD